MIKKNPKILAISNGKFSGTSASLIAALRDKGCEVVEAKSSLWSLRLIPLYAVHMLVNALLIYKRKFRRYLNRTYASYAARSKANNVLVNQYDDADVVILIQANSLNFWKNKKRGKYYTIFTDHTNLLSKQLPENGFKSPESNVHASWNEIEGDILSRQDHIFVMGSHVEHSMVDDYGIDANKITVVGAGPNLDVDIERDGIDKNYNRKQILFVGLEVERKGLRVLEKAFDKVLEIYPDATLHIVGTDGVSGDGKTYYGKLVDEPLKRLFYESQIFALPTYREPFGVVFLEAMFAKNVCIGTSVGAIPKIIDDGQSGYIIEPGDEVMLANKIIDLLSDPNLLKKMAENGYHLAKTKWTWDKVAEKIVHNIQNRNHP